MPLRRWQQITWRWLAGVLAVLVLLVALMLGLFRTLAPVVPGYRARAQAWASRVLEHPVSIASMGAQWGLYGPELTLDNVELFTHDRQRVVIAARQIRLGFTFSAIFHGRFSRPNRIVLIAPRLTLERDTDGSYDIVGLKGSLTPGREHTDWRRTAAEVLAQNAEVLVRAGEVTLIDMRRPAQPLTFTGIRLNLDNSLDHHRISGRLQLPRLLGRSLAFSLRVRGAAAEPQTWHWQGEVDGHALDLAHSLAYWPMYTGRFRSGQVDVHAALAGTGEHLLDTTVSMDARHVTPSSGTSGFDRLAGTVHWARSGAGWTLDGRDLKLRRGADIWPVTRFDLQHTDVSANRSSWSGAISFLRLQDMVQLSTWLPADTSSAITRLQQLSPKGDLRAVRFVAVRTGQALSTWSLKGHFEKLGLHAEGKIPGFSGLSGSLSADQGGGTLAFKGADANITFPHLFRGPLTLSTLTVALRFHHDMKGWHFDLANLSAGNPDVAHATAQGTLLIPAEGGSPVIDLQARVQDANAARKSPYLPVGIMPKKVVQWLDRAIVGGQVPNGSLVLRGKLADFPYDKGQGLFDIRFHLVHGTLDYAKGWPAVRGLDADVEFKDQGMSVAVQHGTVMNDDISGAAAHFADLRKGLLDLKGMARGSAQTALDFLRDAHLKDRFGHVLDGLSATGDADVHLDLQLPVEHPKQYALEGRVQLRNTSLMSAALPQWPVSNLNGTVKITQDGVSAKQVQGKFIGAPFSLSLQPDAQQATTLITVQGGVKSSDLTTALPAAYRLVLTGETRWQITGTLPDKPAETSAGLSLQFASSLQGLGVDLPAPFSKAADAVIPLHASISMDTDRLLHVQLAYGKVVEGVAEFAGQNDAWNFDKGELTFGGGPAVLPEEPGLMVIGALPEFALSAWKPFVPPTMSGNSAALPEPLLGTDLTIGKFSGFNQHIDNLHVALARAAGEWKLDLSSPTVSGAINWPYHVDAGHPVVADMQRVELAREPLEKRTGPPPKLDPKRVPPLRLTIKQFQYNGAKLEDLHAELSPQPDGVKLAALSVANPGFSLQANGQWTEQPDGSEHTQINANLKTTDVARTLQSFGFAPAISGNAGDLEANLHWQGGPLAEILPNLNGKLHIRLRHGSLLDVKPGAGRVFGLLSINALPRHLLLNFSDVLGKGFAYDTIEGHFTLKNGDAYTPDLTVSGPAAKIRMVGRTGLVSHDFDEAVVVMPSVGSTLPVLGALAGGVGVGAVVFLLTEIFKKPLSQVGETRYHLSGTWDNPKLTEIAAPKPAGGKSH